MPSTWPYSVDASVVVSSGVVSLKVYSTSKLGEPMVPLTLQNCAHHEHAPASFRQAAWTIFGVGLVTWSSQQA